MNIMIIDDDVDDTELFCAALKKVLPGAVCTVRSSCAQIENDIRSLPLQDYIFIDGPMTPLNGFECLTLLKTLIDTKLTKVIIHTGSTNPMEIARFRTLVASDVITKSNGFDTLKLNLQSLLKGEHLNNKNIREPIRDFQ